MLLASAVNQYWAPAVEVRIIRLLTHRASVWTSDVAAAEFPRRCFKFFGGDEMAEHAHPQVRYALSAPVWANYWDASKADHFGQVIGALYL